MEFYNIAAIALSLFGAVYVAVTAIIESAETLYQKDANLIDEGKKAIEQDSDNDKLKSSSQKAYKKLIKHNNWLLYIKYFIIFIFSLFAFGMAFTAPWYWEKMVDKSTFDTWKFSIFISAILFFILSIIALVLRFFISSDIEKLKEFYDIDKDNGESKFKKNINTNK